MGRAPTTGKYTTRTELVKNVHFFYHNTEQNLSQVARTTGIETGTASSILNKTPETKVDIPEERLKRMSGAHIVADMIRAAPATKIVNTKWLCDGTRGLYLSKTTAGGIIHKLKLAGILRSIGSGNYMINKDRTHAYYKNKKFYAPYKSRFITKDDSTQTIEPVRSILSTDDNAPVIDTSDVDIINNLLNALAQAEPILQKYKKIIEAVHS